MLRAKSHQPIPKGDRIFRLKGNRNAIRGAILGSVSAYLDGFCAAELNRVEGRLLPENHEYEMDRESFQRNQDLNVPVNSQLSGRIHLGLL